MILTLAAVALEANVPAVVALNAGAGQGAGVTQLKVANESPWPLYVQLGTDTHVVPAWMADLLPVHGSSSVTLTPQPIISATAAYSSADAILTTAGPSDVIPGTYPAPLVRAQQQLPSMCKLAESAALGATSIAVDNPAALTPGGFVWLQPPNGSDAGQGSSGIPYPLGFIDMAAGTAEIPIGLLNAYEAGSFVINVPVTVVGATTQPIEVSGQTFGNITPVLVQPPSPLSAPINVNTGATGISHVIAGTAGKTILLRAMVYQMSAAGAAAGDWQDTGAHVVGYDTFQNNAPRNLPFERLPLPAGAGAGLDWNCTNAGALVYVTGYVLYDLQ